MKILMTPCLLILFNLAGISRDLGTSWVIIDEDKVICKKIVMEHKEKSNTDIAHIIFANGHRSSLDVGRISSFCMNNKTYVKLPLYKDGKDTGKKVFMELINTCGELSLYKYGMCKLETPDPKIKMYCYFLYHGDKLYKHMSAEKLANIDRSFRRDCSLDD
jgi:hypothetical protein